MITSMKIMNKRFRLIAPLLLAIMIIAMVVGAAEMSRMYMEAAGSNLQYNYSYDGGQAAGGLNLAVVWFPAEQFVVVTFLVVCLLSAVVTAYKNEHNYSTNMMATQNQNIIANSMLGIIVGLMIAVTYAIAYYAGMHMEANRCGNIITSSVANSLVCSIALGALMAFIVFNAMYYVILFLSNLFKHNKLLCLMAFIGFALIYMCILVFPVGTLEENHPYIVFIWSWKGQMSVAALYVILGIASYVGLVKNCEVKK